MATQLLCKRRQCEPIFFRPRKDLNWSLHLLQSTGNNTLHCFFVAKVNVTVQLLGIGSGVTAESTNILDAPGAIDIVTPAEHSLQKLLVQQLTWPLPLTRPLRHRHYTC